MAAIFIILSFFNYSFSQLSYDKPVFFNELKDSTLNEISGIVKSHQHDIFWVHNDSGGEPIIYGFDVEGNTTAKLVLEIKNNDWEDISYGSIDNKYYLFIGEFGDNLKQYDVKNIYIVEEPENLIKEIYLNKDKVKSIKFRTEENFDFEALFFNPINKNLYMITKGLQNENVYEISYPYNFNDTLDLQKIGNLTLSNPSKNNINKITAGEVSFDGNYLALKDYGNIYLYNIKGDVKYILSNEPDRLTYYMQLNEPQGEAICWGVDNYNIYTVGEEIFGIPAKVQFFRNLNTSNINDVDTKIKLNDDSIKIYYINGKKLEKNELINYKNKFLFIYNLEQNESKLIYIDF